MSLQDDVRALFDAGLNPLPCRKGEKHPGGVLKGWKQYQRARVTEQQLQGWFTRAFEGRRNVWTPLGVAFGYVVLDCDGPAAEAYWRERIGSEMDATACVATRQGHHYWFRTSEGAEAFPSWSGGDKAVEGSHFDVQADGKGVVVPPSIHESGHVYRWERPLEAAVAVPAALYRPAGATSPGDGRDGVSSMLSALLRQAEGMVEHDGRNEMLAKLAGHYAKAFHVEEMYREQCRVVNERVFGEPVDDEEFDKTVTSIWQREQAKGATVVHGADGEPLRVGEATQDNGWLISAKTRLLTEVTRKDEDGEKTTELEQWADFDIRCLGIVDDPPHTPRSYFVEIHRANERVIPDVLKATTLADTRSTVAWFLDRGCSILPPDGSKHRQAPGPRLAAYLNSQGAPMFEVVDSLGFHREAGGFVTLEGVITHDGPTGYTSHVPDPVIRKRVDYRYGFDGTMEDARWVLNEVLTFHKTIEAAVFGSWWAACLLKPMFEDMSSLFPFMALEAPSESGKTTGMFALLIELAGNARGQTLSTRPAFRDAVASHRSGIAWIDDADDIGNLEELLRAITGGGTTAKMAEDRESLAVVKLQAPVLLTGEALNIGDQKALRDRAILLEVRSPTDQKSTRDRTKSQWEDIVALRDRFPKDQGGLTRISGHVVRMALEQAYRVEDFMSLRGAEGKRHGDKVAVLRTGARVLAGMTGRSGWIDAVDHWLDELPDYEAQANSLTLRTLPDLWSRDGFPRTPSESRRWGSPAPVYVREDGIVCFRPIGCAQALVDLRHGRVDQRTETQGAIEGQARQMGARARAVNARVGSDRIRYWTLPAELSASVIRVAQA